MGKGSRDRVSDRRRFEKNFEKIKFRKGVMDKGKKLAYGTAIIAVAVVVLVLIYFI